MGKTNFDHEELNMGQLITENVIEEFIDEAL